MPYPEWKEKFQERRQESNALSIKAHRGLSGWFVEELGQPKLQHWLDLRCVLVRRFSESLFRHNRYFSGQNPHIERVWGVCSKGSPLIGFLEPVFDPMPRVLVIRPCLMWRDGLFDLTYVKGAGKALMEKPWNGRVPVALPTWQTIPIYRTKVVCIPSRYWF